jgi:hypothetical protein
MVTAPGRGVDDAGLDELLARRALPGAVRLRHGRVDVLDRLEGAAGAVQRLDLDDLRVAVGQRNEAAGHARGAAHQAGGARLHDDDVGAGPLDGGGEALADADEDAGHGEHEQARQGERHDGRHIAAPLKQEGGKCKRHGNG